MNMTKVKDWADERADQGVNSIGYREDPEAVIAASLRDVADECVRAVEEKQGMLGASRDAIDLSHPTGIDRSFMLTHRAIGCINAVDAIRARFPRCPDDE